MSNDLISRKALLKHLADWWLSETPSGEVVVIGGELQRTPANKIIEKCIKVVEEQPTAYDIEEVVRQLLIESDSDENCNSFVYLDKAMEVVERIY